jgi:hypothetical protein
MTSRMNDGTDCHLSARSRALERDPFRQRRRRSTRRRVTARDAVDYRCSVPLFITAVHSRLSCRRSQPSFTTVVHDRRSQPSFTTVVHNRGSQPSFTTVVHNRGSQPWFTTVVHNRGSRRSFTAGVPLAVVHPSRQSPVARRQSSVPSRQSPVVSRQSSVASQRIDSRIGLKSFQTFAATIRSPR